jgi:Ca-activated chloride channel family protein
LWEYVSITAFLIIYILYIFRITRIARKLQTHARSIIAKTLLRLFYFTLLIMALLGPTFGEQQREVKEIGKDIYLAIDLSQSMNATDIVPTRLERLKYELTSFTNALPADRIGMIIFSSEAFVQCPLTYDKSALNLFLQTVSSSLVPDAGTHIASALELTLFKHTDSTNTTSANQAKIIILLTDGEDFGENTRKIVKDIENAGIRLFVVGIGTYKGGRIPQGRNYKTNKDGTEVITRLASETLQTLASEAKGSYYEINETRNDLPKLISTIRGMEGQLRDKRKIDVTANKYYYFLAVAFLCMVLDVLITVKTIQL